ncbi:MAG TPA: aminoglycoside phosphotransferase family protein [Lentisphaeria bacterium]|nr:aminoglycoside phosphotransferase family protein [Lentisphaeria bacterium]
MSTTHAATACNDIEYAQLLRQWDLKFAYTRPDIVLAGSPDRSQARMAVEDTDGHLFLLERVFPAKLTARREQAKVLSNLHEFDQPVHPWRSTTSDDCFAYGQDGAAWQLRDYVQGIPLPRPAYASDAWRGECLGGFLAVLHQANKEASLPFTTPFDLPRYAANLVKSYQRNRPELAKDLAPICQELEGFWQDYHKIPLTFCHGDYHPLNIIWGENAINSVIDWEFMGTKAECYDAANMIGCVGMDDPAHLTGPLVMTMLGVLCSHRVWSSASWEMLPEFVATLRFAWLREWVVHEPLATVCQELDLIWLILDNRDLLRKRWQNAE